MIWPKSSFIAILFIAASAFSICARGQNVYKCGSTYSDAPCAGGQPIEVRDTRDPAQQAQTQAATQQAAQQAAQLEKTRLNLEKQARQSTLQRQPVTRTDKPAQPQVSLTVITPKRLKKPGKKPEAFIAEIPGTEKNKPPRKRVKKKPTSTPI